MEKNLKGHEQHEDHDADDVKKRPGHAKPEVNIAATGPTQAALDAAARAALENPFVQTYLKGSSYRLLSIAVVENAVERKANHVDCEDQESTSTDHYLATVYNYTQNNTLLISGLLSTQGVLGVEESYSQPLPNSEEFQAAIEIVEKDAHFGPAIREGHLASRLAMPLLVEEELPDGRVERTLTVALVPNNEQYRYEVVGVNMIHQKVIRFKGGAPKGSLANQDLCGEGCLDAQWVPAGTPGQANVTISQGGTVLWTFRAVRPSASSGKNGSGVELRFVNYRGKRVLYRAHVPILNVQYDKNLCGPYRDWQNAEHVFQANGSDVAPGFRLCPTPAKTILDSGSDAGNFGGVAIYVQGQEVVLVSEMLAGWYRYISEWRFHVDGTIRPRFGFSAVCNPCVCHLHHHHVYWRLDFDIRTAGDNVVREYNNPPIIGNSHLHTKYQEIRRMRDASHQRHWQVENGDTGEGYMILPGSNDGTADSFGGGDLWVLRYHGDELDDGQLAAPESLDKFVNGEPVYKQDIVLWYGAHFTHDVQNEGANHVVGPDLKPFNWR